MNVLRACFRTLGWKKGPLPGEVEQLTESSNSFIQAFYEAERFILWQIDSAFNKRLGECYQVRKGADYREIRFVGGELATVTTVWHGILEALKM